MKRTVFFDLGNVLIFFDHQKMFRQVAECTGLSVEWVEEVMLKYIDLYERGYVDSAMLHDEFCRMAQKKLDFEALMRAASDIFQPNEEAIALAAQVKERGHRIFLLSNTCDAHFAFASNAFPFLKMFDGYVLSYEVGARKPEKKIYEKALEIAGCRNEESFYTDDILPYVETARSLEIDAEQFTTAHNLKKHLVARGIL